MPAALAAATKPGGFQNETTSSRRLGQPADFGRGPDRADRDDEAVRDERPDRGLGAGRRHRHLDDAATCCRSRACGRERVVRVAATEHRQDPLPSQLVDHVHADTVASSSDACGYDRAAPNDRHESVAAATARVSARSAGAPATRSAR